jgi:sugar phosphate isomerase/epimerase
LKTPLRLIWDSHHTWRLAQEAPEGSWALLSPFIKHIHYKDSVALPGSSEGAYVIPGRGEYPTAALRQLLEASAFDGGVSLEWERHWHRDLPPLEDTLPAFQALFCR